MRSTRAGFARPVRMVAKSCLRASTALLIRRSASLKISATIATLPCKGDILARCRPHIRTPTSDDLLRSLCFFHVMNERAVPFATHDTFQCPRLVHIEHDDGQVVILAQRKGGAVHDLQAHIQGSHVAQFFELTSRSEERR